MASRVNLMIEDNVMRLLKKVPQGQRSFVVNAALRQWFKANRRRRSAEKMDSWRENLPEATARELADWVRRDRERDDP